MKKYLFILVTFLFIITGCSSKVDPNESETNSIELENGLKVTINDKQLLDLYGEYYTDEDNALLVLNVKIENTTEQNIIFSPVQVKLYINNQKQNAMMNINTEEAIKGIITIASGDTLEGDIVFASLPSYSKSDKVTLNFIDPSEKELGKLKLDLTDLENEYL